MPTIEPMDVPDSPREQRAEKEWRLREIEGQRHPTDRPDGPAGEVAAALDPEVTER